MTIETLGMRNNNPGNIRYTGIDWKGAIGKQQGFVVFGKIVDGVRAIAVIWRVYMALDKITTIRGGVARWAPPTENDTNNYIRAVCEETGLAPDDPIPVTLETVRNIIAAIIRHENGDAMWTFFCANRGGLTTIEDGIAAAGWKFTEAKSA